MDRLLELLRKHSYREGRFTLASGKESDFFIDCKRTVLLAEGHVLVGEALRRRLPPETRAVAGVVLGGCPLASAVAYASQIHGDPVDALLVRKATKDHGTREQIEGASHLESGARVAVLEDTVTTGGSTLRAIDWIRDAGLQVDRVIAVVDRLEGGAAAIRDAGVAFEALYTRADFIPS